MSTTTAPRIDAHALPGALRTLYTLHAEVNGTGLEQPLIELVRTRASQLNGCAFCLDMHTRDARAAGETEQRLHLLAAWREAPLYDARERAALAFTEAVTVLDDGVPDEVLEACEAVFTPEELTALLFAVIEINAWNRLNVGARRTVEVQR